MNDVRRYLRRTGLRAVRRIDHREGAVAEWSGVDCAVADAVAGPAANNIAAPTAPTIRATVRARPM
ncbi:hypothetical protein [Rhodococcus sp. IEGM 1379]|uniref:hypothetical protein n=1 Tax=Rhodococcus sp. IEGM 1379 TaxID=3047086 RepID=UPI0024B6CAEC|nr:hypothetical protein [Rhodococcus sp. IEGM 1379]MDI9916919.1 hypothetical protein [Rhodococcus sp. IEGM 1379]